MEFETKSGGQHRFGSGNDTNTGTPSKVIPYISNKGVSLSESRSHLTETLRKNQIDNMIQHKRQLLLLGSIAESQQVAKM